MTLRSWYQSLQLQHAFAFLIECLWTTLILGGVVLAGLYFNFLPIRFTLPIFALALFAFFAWRYTRCWTQKGLWKSLEKREAHLKDRLPIIEDLLLDRVHAPDPNMVEVALDQLSQSTPRSAYPWSAHFLKRPLEFLIFIPLFLFLMAAQQYQQKAPQPENIVVKIIPPEYLKKKTRELDFEEVHIDVYPSTLMTLLIDPGDSEYQLKDQQSHGSLFLPIKTNTDQLRYEVRLMKKSNLVLLRDGRVFKEWTVDLLKDFAPEIAWSPQPKAPQGWKKVQLRYRASDDIALGDAFIVVNNQEREYAGKPNGQKSYQYGWSFDPLEYLDLQGGNVELRVAIYDQDNVPSPKAAFTEPVIWPFPGIQKLLEQALEKTKETKQAVLDRQDFLEDQKKGPDRKISKHLKDLGEELENNPVLPGDMKELVQRMESERFMTDQKWSKRNPPKSLSNQEKEQNERNLLYLDSIENKLKDLLDMVKASQIVQELAELTEKLENGEPVDSKDFEKLFEKLSKHADQSNMSPFDQQQSKLSMEKAQLANELGEKGEAAQELKDLMEQMKNAFNMENNVQSELAQRYSELKEMLRHLIHEQSENQIQTEEAFKQQAIPKPELVQKMRDMAKNISKLEPAQKYKENLEALKKAMSENKGGLKTQELVKNLDQPDRRQGQELHRLQYRLNRLADQIGDKGLNSNLKNLTHGLMSPQQLSKISPSEKELTQKYSDILKELRAPLPKVKVQREVLDIQNEIQSTAQTFAKEFRRDFQMMIRDPRLFNDADTGAWHADNANKMLNQHNAQSIRQMSQAVQKWKSIMSRLQQLEKQSQQMMMAGGGQKQKMMQMGRDGKLQLTRREGRGDARNGRGQRDVGIALPEDFKKPKEIEKRLHQEMKTQQGAIPKELFKSYMLDLLQ